MIGSTGLLIGFLALCGFGAVLAALLPDRKNPPALACIGAAASLLLLGVSGSVLLYGQTVHVTLWRIPSLGNLALEMDRLSALFLFITALVYLPVSIFSASYLRKYIGHYSLKSFGSFYHLLFASIVLTLVAGDVFSFLIAWEAMSLLCYVLVNYEHEEEETTRSGFIMLVMSEVGTLAAAVGLLALANASGGIGFGSLRGGIAHLGPSARWAVFLLSFFGFGVKAGLVPMNTWLPRAHPVAPANISALLSGVILNLGVYGIVRVNADILGATVPGPGLVVLAVGSVSAVIGILYATTEGDMKKMLAHSSIENMGIIAAGLGAGLTFMAYHHPALAGIAFVAAFYHTINHSLYKALLFLGAGGVDTQVGWRDMNLLGGLIRRMPWTSFFFLAGALSIAALPPFNGFVSEWLTLQTLLQCAVLQSVGSRIVFALSGAGLALTAALAVTCFVKAFAMTFLGVSRSEAAKEATEPPRGMTAPMGVLAVLCLCFGVLPTYVIPVVDGVVSPLVHESVADELTPPFFTVGERDPKFGESFVSEFHDLGAQVGRGWLPGRGLVVLHRGGERNPVVFAMSTSYTFVVLILLLGGSYLGVRFLTRTRAIRCEPAWDGGVRRLSPDMTYTATGFSNPVRVLFDAIFRPSSAENTKEAVAEHFRTVIKNGGEAPHIIDRGVLDPLTRSARRLAAVLGRMHSGRVNGYAAYVLITLLIFLLITNL